MSEHSFNHKNDINLFQAKPRKKDRMNERTNSPHTHTHIRNVDASGLDYCVSIDLSTGGIVLRTWDTFRLIVSDALFPLILCARAWIFLFKSIVLFFFLPFDSFIESIVQNPPVVILPLLLQHRSTPFIWMGHSLSVTFQHFPLLLLLHFTHVSSSCSKWNTLQRVFSSYMKVMFSK